MPVTIIRPGIVRGHSITGETIKFDGPYFFMNMIDRLKWMPVIPYVGKSDAHINVVPIDYIIDASIYLVTHEEAAGQNNSFDRSISTFSRGSLPCNGL